MATTTATVRPEIMENGQEKCPGFCYTGGKNTSTWITYTRKRGRPEVSKSVKSKIEQKPELFENNSDNEYDNFEPHTPTKKRGRTARSKSTKRKVSPKSPLVDSRSNTSEGKKDNDEDFEPKVSHGRKKYARVKGTAQALLRISGGIRSPGPNTDDDFAAMKSFDNFKVVVGDGMVEALPDDCVRETRKAFLHGQQTSPTHALEMIVETAKIADGIRACDSDSLEDLTMWKKTLESFESQGMDVAFLRQRVNDLLGLLGAPPVEPESSFAYKQLKLMRADFVKQLRNIKSTMSSLKHTLKEIDAEMVQASLDKKKEQAMRKLATAPW